MALIIIILFFASKIALIINTTMHIIMLVKSQQYTIKCTTLLYLHLQVVFTFQKKMYNIIMLK
jgi:hypothetical protein